MSLTLTLTSAAIVAGITISQTALTSIAIAVANGKNDELEDSFETCFVDVNILIKTLEEMDCIVTKVSENEILVETTCGNLRYVRNNEKENFRMCLNEITDVDGLLENIRSFEQDYGRNVQAYTYGHIKKNLSGNMKIVEEEVMDDDTLMLTINIDE